MAPQRKPLQAPKGDSGLSYYRALRKVTQAALAIDTKIEVSRLSRIEVGDLIPNAAEVDAISDALETPPTRLFSKHILAEVAERAGAA